MSWLDSLFNKGPAGTPGTNGTNGAPGLGLSQAFSWTSLAADGWTTIYTLFPPLATNEALDIYANVEIGKATAGSGYLAKWSRALGVVQNVGGSVLNTAGNAPTDHDTTTPDIGNPLIGAAARILVSGTNVYVQAQRPTGLSGLYAAGVVDFVRGVPAAHSAVTAISPSSLAPSVGSPVLMTITLNFGGFGATQASIGSTILTGLTVVSDTQITGFLPSGTYTVGTFNVNVTAPAAPMSLAGGFAFSPVISSISPSSDYAYGGTPVTITGSGFTGASSAALNGINLTSFSVVDDGHITGNTGSTTNPANVGLGPVTVVNGAVTATGANLWTYNHDPLTILGATNVYVWIEARSCTQSGGVVSAITDLSGSGNAPTGVTSIAYVASESAFGNVPSWTFNGTSSFLNFGTVTNPSSQAVMDFVVIEMLSTSTAALVSIAGNAWEVRENGSMQILVDGVGPASWGTNTGVLNTPTTVCAYGQSGGAGNATAAITVANGTPQTATGGGAGFPYSANTSFTFGSRPAGSIPMNFKCPCYVKAIVQPTSTQLTQLQTYAHSRWGV